MPNKSVKKGIVMDFQYYVLPFICIILLVVAQVWLQNVDEKRYDTFAKSTTHSRIYKIISLSTILSAILSALLLIPQYQHQSGVDMLPSVHKFFPSADETHNGRSGYNEERNSKIVENTEESSGDEREGDWRADESIQKAARVPLSFYSTEMPPF